MAPNRRGRTAGALRDYEVEARKRAFAGARYAIDQNVTLELAAEHTKSKTNSVQEAMTVLNFGTEEEIIGVETGNLSMRGVCDSIRKRNSGRNITARKPAKAPLVEAEREFDAEVWARLKQALDILTGMPAANDVVTIVRKNVQRTEAASRKALAAHTWLEDFVNAWTE